MPDTMVDAEVLKDAVQLACRAPSLHERVRHHGPPQWTYLYVDRAGYLYYDKSRRPSSAAARASIITMAGAGWTPSTMPQRLPITSTISRPSDLTRLASVTDRPSPPADAILRRRTIGVYSRSRTVALRYLAHNCFGEHHHDA